MVSSNKNVLSTEGGVEITHGIAESLMDEVLSEIQNLLSMYEIDGEVSDLAIVIRKSGTPKPSIEPDGHTGIVCIEDSGADHPQFRIRFEKTSPEEDSNL